MVLVGVLSLDVLEELVVLGGEPRVALRTLAWLLVANVHVTLEVRLLREGLAARGTLPWLVAV